MQALALSKLELMETEADVLNDGASFEAKKLKTVGANNLQCPGVV